jgi:hypothetical protein
LISKRKRKVKIEEYAPYSAYKKNSTDISPSFEPRMPQKNVTFAYKPFQ